MWYFFYIYDILFVFRMWLVLAILWLSIASFIVSKWNLWPDWCIGLSMLCVQTSHIPLYPAKVCWVCYRDTVSCYRITFCYRQAICYNKHRMRRRRSSKKKRRSKRRSRRRRSRRRNRKKNIRQSRRRSIKRSRIRNKTRIIREWW